MQQLLGEVKRSAFGRRLGRRSYAFCVDLLAVISGVRLAFLNDYCASSTQELEPFLKDLKKVLDANHLRCLVFEAVDYTFFVNMNLLSACLDAGSVSSMILVDVSPLHTSPVVVQNKTDNPLQPTIESIRDALVSCPTNVAEVDLPMGSSDTLIITLAAVLLEFKVAFVIQEPAQGAQQSNCLGFIPLTIFTVDVGMEKSSHKLLSFSCPTALLDSQQIQDIKQSLLHRYLERLSTQTLFGDVRVRIEDVQLDRVLL